MRRRDCEVEWRGEENRFDERKRKVRLHMEGYVEGLGGY